MSTKLLLARLAVLGSFVSTLLSAGAATYYVNPINGDDSGSARSPNLSGPNAPWKTLERASRQDFRNGDELLLICGISHEGTLDLRVSEGEGQLRVGGYGECGAGNLPRIDGSRPISASEINGHLRASLPFEPGRVLVDGKVLPRGFSVYKISRSNSGAQLLMLNPPLPKGIELSQARAYARTRDWFVEPIRLQSSTNIAADLGSYKTQYPINAGVTLAITGKEAFLKSGTWIYDTTIKQLVIASTVKNVRVSPLLPLIRVKGNGSVLIDGLRLENAGEDAIEIAVKGTAAVRGAHIVSPARRAINLNTAASLYAIDNHISGAGEDAIFIGSTDKATVSRNSIQDTATLEPIQPAVGAINVTRAKSAIVTQNSIERSAYIGIRFGEGADVASNLVVDSCVALSDCAAIYTWQEAAADRRPSRVAGNLIVGVYGNDDVKLGFRVWAVGIYLDDYTSGVVVEDNLIFGARQGIYFHNAFSNRAERNAIVGDLETSVSVQLDKNDPFLLSKKNLGNQFIGNLLMPSGKADTIQVVRRVPLEPFSQFKAIYAHSASSKAAISWIENTSDFDKPTFQRVIEPNGLLNSIANGLESKVTSLIPAATDWKVERLRTGFRIFGGSRNFHFSQTDQPTPQCKEVALYNSGALTLANTRSKLFNCI